MSTVQEDAKTLFRKAVERAILAPSIHNTQPWHFVVRPGVLELRADNDRRRHTNRRDFLDADVPGDVIQPQPPG